MSGCDKCSGHSHEDDCCSSHSHSVETSHLGGKIFKYGITILASTALSFFAFQPSKVYRVKIDNDDTKDVVVERYFTNWRYFYKGEENAKFLEQLKPSDGLTWEVMNERFEAEKKSLENK